MTHKLSVLIVASTSEVPTVCMLIVLMAGNWNVEQYNSLPLPFTIAPMLHVCLSRSPEMRDSPEQAARHFPCL
jgi:hypothetical protein